MKKIESKQFNDNSSTGSLTDFIPWELLVDPDSRFVSMGTITFEIQLFASPLLCLVPQEIIAEQTKFYIFIEKMSKITRVKSSKVILQGIGWHIYIAKESDSLGIYLFCEDSKIPVNWSYEANCKFRFLTVDSEKPPIEKEMTFIFRRGCLNRGFKCLETWDAVMNASNAYVKGDAVHIEVNLKIAAPQPLWSCGTNQLQHSAFPLDCPICMESMKNSKECGILATKCGHIFCGKCINSHIEKDYKCPLCNQPSNKKQLRKIYLLL